jgi:hypothetical protein
MNTPFVHEYSEMFENLDLSFIPRYSDSVGSKGYDQHSMIKALIIKALEGYRSNLQLIREIKSKPFLCEQIIGFKDGNVPDDSTLSRFLNKLDPELLKEALARTNKKKLRKAARLLISSQSTQSP